MSSRKRRRTNESKRQLTDDELLERRELVRERWRLQLATVRIEDVEQQ